MLNSSPASCSLLTSQNLWLLEKDGEHLLTEVGSMNLFVVLKRGDGELKD